MINTNYSYQAKTFQTAFERDQQFPHVTLLTYFDKRFYRQIKLKINGLKWHRKVDLCSNSCYISVTPAILNKYLNSVEFKEFIFAVTSQKILRFQSELYQLKQKDYVVRNDNAVEEPGIDLVIDFTSVWDNLWGGYVSYIDSEGNTLTLPSTPNSLTIIERKPGVSRFVKYINHQAKTRCRTFCLVRLRSL